MRTETSIVIADADQTDLDTAAHLDATPVPADQAAPVAERRSERGSQTIEYALLFLAGGTIVTLVVSWAKDGGVNNIIKTVIDSALGAFGLGG